MLKKLRENTSTAEQKTIIQVLSRMYYSDNQTIYFSKVTILCFAISVALILCFAISVALICLANSRQTIAFY